jgi:putative molybdopterin biosynthesis protein
MIYQVLEEVGELLFHGVNLKPGKPTIFGLIAGKPCLGLPGYPTSALSVFSQLAAPAIRAALGQRHSGIGVAAKLAAPLRLEGRRQMLAVGLSGSLAYPVDKGSGSITTLAGADGIIDIPAGVEYLEKGEAVVVELFAGAEPADLVVAGENSIFLEKLAESLPLRLALLNTGSLQARLYLEDGVADIACVSGPAVVVAEGMTVIGSRKRELGLIFRGGEDLQDVGSRRIAGWHKDSAMKAAWERILNEKGLTHPRYVRVARTHSAVAAAVASGRADLGYAERQAAEDADLGFLSQGGDELIFLSRQDRKSDPRLKPLLSALSQEGGV